MKELSYLPFVFFMVVASCSDEELAGKPTLESSSNYSVNRKTTFTVTAPAVSATFGVDGGLFNPGVDIVYLEGSDGYLYVDALTNGYQPGSSTEFLTIPDGDYNRQIAGDWIVQYGCEVCSGFQTFKQSKAGTSTAIRVNVVLVSQSDISSRSSSSLQLLISEFSRVLSAATLQVVEIRYWSVESSDTIVTSTDIDANGQSDAMDRLFSTHSPNLPTGFVNLFFVNSITLNGDTVLGIAGGLPGPTVNGTPHSGVLVNTLGGLTRLSSAGIKTVGITAAHETGHFLGLHHPSESGGDRFDPISDTPQCSIGRDANGDGKVAANECIGFGSDNFMFWADNGEGNQIVSTSGQQFVLQRAQLVQ